MAEEQEEELLSQINHILCEMSRIEKESFLKLLSSSYCTNQENRNETNVDDEKSEEEDEEEYDDDDDEDEGADWLPMSKTIRFDDNNGNNGNNINYTKLSPIIETNKSHSHDHSVTHSLENLGDIKDSCDEETDDELPCNNGYKLSSNVSYIDWTNYAFNHLRNDHEEKLEYYSNKELFIVLSNYVLIYSKPGDKNGHPRDLKDGNELSVIGILNKYELVLIAAKQRDYTTECYVKCLLPIQGWIYLPKSIINKWINSDLVTNSNLSLSTNYSNNFSSKLKLNSNSNLNSITNDNKFYHGTNFHEIDIEYIYQNKEINNNHIWKKLEDDRNINRINFLDQIIAPLTHPLPRDMIHELNDDDIDDIDDYDDNDDKEEDDDIKEPIPIQPKQRGKCVSTLINLLNWIVKWMRAHPYFPGLAITLIQAGIEIVIFFDIITDVIVVSQLARVSNNLLLSLFFTFSVIFLVSPYMIGWVATTQWMLRKLQQRKLEKQRSNRCNRYLWRMAFILFNIAPIGVLTLFIGDIIHLIEYVIHRPIAYLIGYCLSSDDNDNDDNNNNNNDDNNHCTLLNVFKLRTISFEELGYWKLRRVSEIFAETIPQSVLQLLLLLLLSSPRAREELNLNVFSVVAALISSAFVTLFWCVILLFESKTNGMNFVEYITVVFQGSFKFVPYLPAIERGKKTGIDVNWTRYGLDVDGLGLVAKSLISPNCKIEKLKISLYTIANLHRNAAKYFGQTIYQYNTNNINNKYLELIISREEDDIKHLFTVYDIDSNWYFDFEEFARCCIVMRKDVEKSVNLYNVSSLFWELAGKNDDNQQIYLLDLLLKMGSSKSKIALLDYDNTLLFATKNNQINLISLLMGSNYDKLNQSEFTKCVIGSTINQKQEHIAMTLCEQRGIPIVVEILSANLKKIYNPFVIISIGDIEIKTKLLYNTSNPYWHKEYLLFIIPFNQINEIIRKSDDIDVDIGKYNANKPLNEEQEEPSKPSMNAPRPMMMTHDIDNDESEDDESDDSEYTLDENDYIENRKQSAMEKQMRKQIILQEKDDRVPPMIEIEINPINRDRMQSESNPITRDRMQSESNDNYNATLFAINEVTMRTERGRRCSLSTSYSVNNENNNNNNNNIKTTPTISTRDLKLKLADLWNQNGYNMSRSMTSRSMKQRLMINVKVHHLKIEEDDETEIGEELIGGCKLKIDVSSENTSKFHEKTITQNLQIRNRKRSKNNKSKFLVSGKLSMKIYLNVLHKYDKYGLKYIEMKHKSSSN